MQSLSALSLDYLTTLLVSPAIQVISPLQIHALYRILRERLQKASSSPASSPSAADGGWQIRIAISTQTAIPPSPLLAACLAVGLRWKDWRRMIFNGEGYDMLVFVAEHSSLTAYLGHQLEPVILWRAQEAECILTSSHTSLSPESSPSPLTPYDSCSKDGVPSAMPGLSSSPGWDGIRWIPLRPLDRSIKLKYTGGSTRMLSGGVLLSANPENGRPKVKPGNGFPNQRRQKWGWSNAITSDL